MNGPAGEPSRPAGRADVTGPLPVTAPADTTGPMPVPPAASAWQEPGAGDATGPQPLPDSPDPAASSDTTPSASTGPVAAPPSWFGEGEESRDAAATGPTDTFLANTTPTAPSPQVDGAPVEQTPPAAHEAPTADAPPPQTTFFEAVAPQQTDPSTAPATSLFEAVAPAHDDTGTPPATTLFQAVAPQQTDTAAPPATSLFESVAPQQTDTGTAPATSLFEAVTPAYGDSGTPPATSLFEAVAPQPADAGAPPATNLFEPVRPHTGSAPATGLFEAVGSAVPSTGAGMPRGPAGTAQAVDVTGPMPAVGATLAPADGGPGPGSPSAGGAPPATTALPLIGSDGRVRPASTLTAGTATEAAQEPALVPGAPADRPPHTDAWAFGPDSGALSHPESSRAGVGGETPAQVTTEPPPALPAPALPSDRPRRSTWPLTVLGVLAAIAAGIALVFWIARTDPGDLVAAATEGLATWNGVHYRGAMAARDGGEIQFDVIVTAEGASGTLTRDGGRATAELLWDESGILLRANRNWWLYHHAARADDLADTWVSEPLTETQEIDPILALHPAALARHIHPEQPASTWKAIEQQIVGGVPAILLSDGTRRVLVNVEEPHQLLALDIGPTQRAAPVQVNDVSADEADIVAREATGVRSAEAPRTLAQRLRERPLVAIQLQPEPLCVTETCGVTVTVTNSGTVPARGHLEISADGKIVANHPLEVHPGQVATFTARAPNPHFSNPGATGEILWESRAVDD
jgi:hypothetical protein